MTQLLASGLMAQGGATFSRARQAWVAGEESSEAAIFWFEVGQAWVALPPEDRFLCE